MLAIADWALLEAEMFTTARNIDWPTALRAMELSYYAIPVWNAAMTCIKISVALSLLRVPVNRAWTVFLWTVTAVQIAYFIGNSVYTFLACVPLHAIWDFTVAGANCLGPASSRIASNVGSAINITTDVLLSLAPMVLLWGLRRPLRERILVCGLMGIGLLASVACIAKAVAVRRWGDPELETWSLAMAIATWTIVEQLLAVLAACSPSLKRPLQKILGRFGILLTHYRSHVSFMRDPGGKAAKAHGLDHEAHPNGPVHFCLGDSTGSVTEREKTENNLSASEL